MTLPALSVPFIQNRQVRRYRHYSKRLMTIGIGVIANDGKSLILVSDSMLSTGETSGDRIAFKSFPLTGDGRWCVLVSGDDMSPIEPIVQKAVVAMLHLDPKQLDVETVERLFVSAYPSSTASVLRQTRSYLRLD